MGCIVIYDKIMGCCYSRNKSPNDNKESPLDQSSVPVGQNNSMDIPRSPNPNSTDGNVIMK
jgi:hypothetical protein